MVHQRLIRVNLRWSLQVGAWNALSLRNGDGPGICLGDGQMEAPGALAESGRSDTLWCMLHMQVCIIYSLSQSPRQPLLFGSLYVRVRAEPVEGQLTGCTPLHESQSRHRACQKANYRPRCSRPATTSTRGGTTIRPDLALVHFS